MANISILFGQVGGSHRVPALSPSCGGGRGWGHSGCVRVDPPQVVRGLSAGARVLEFMTLEPKVPLRGGASIPSHSLLGHIAFNHVSFR